MKKVREVTYYMCDRCDWEIKSTHSMMRVNVDGVEKHYHVGCKGVIDIGKVETVGDMIKALGYFKPDTKILVRRATGYEYEYYDDTLPELTTKFFDKEKGIDSVSGECSRDTFPGCEGCLVIQ